MFRKLNKMFPLVIVVFFALEVNILTNAQENQFKVKVQTFKQERYLKHVHGHANFSLLPILRYK